MRHDGGSPMRRDTIFRMASTSKPVTVAAAMVLLDECRLRLDDPVVPWLPELADRRGLTRVDGPLDNTVPARRPITVRDPADLHVRARDGHDVVGHPNHEQGLRARAHTPSPGAEARAGRVDASPRRASTDAPTRRALAVPDQQ
ncbi:serine hydrolase [Micromonospora sp. NPDC050397]|uniref:serine hydrolase n=1 Tax=Micromonospora sp. NPDC050397 TaxID=3364279 RepID=UPI0038504A54